MLYECVVSIHISFSKITKKYVKIESALVCYKVRNSTYLIMMNKRQAKQQKEAKNRELS